MPPTALTYTISLAWAIREYYDYIHTHITLDLQLRDAPQILGISMLAVSEAMNLGVKLGADPRTLAAIINTSSGRCWSSDTYNPVSGVQPNVPSSRGYTGGQCCVRSGGVATCLIIAMRAAY